MSKNCGQNPDHDPLQLPRLLVLARPRQRAPHQPDRSSAGGRVDFGDGGDMILDDEPVGAEAQRERDYEEMGKLA